MNIQELTHCFFCTGARNQSLLSEFNQNHLSFEVDERIASFKALGLAKAQKKPVAVCTTSGTAVSECLSALIEAQLSEVPLLLITADRPKRMQGSGAPQTIHHEIITRGYRKTYLEVGPEELRNLKLNEIQYPAHVNVVIETKDEKEYTGSEEYSDDWGGFAEFLKKHPRPIFLISHGDEDTHEIFQRLLEMRLTVYAEVMTSLHQCSPLRFEEDLILGLKQKAFTSVIRLGHTPLTKFWRMLEKFHLPVFSFDSRNLPALSYGTVMPLTQKALLNESIFWKVLSEVKPFELKTRSYQSLQELLHEYPDSEMASLEKLQQFIPEGSHVYLGNSLTIRYFELVQSKSYHIWGNRGANGIDGQLATACGIAKGLDLPLYCILGDMTLFYDLSSLLTLPSNLKLIVMNNRGGRIFETLNMPREIVLEHEKNFGTLAMAMGLTYAMNDFSQLEEVQILELSPQNEQSMAFLKRWQA
jgi:2-succinyl-5-enolpyruvyl-6-hydroxy-3-cyclohexene-1-carboxylate synthase